MITKASIQNDLILWNGATTNAILIQKSMPRARIEPAIFVAPPRNKCKLTIKFFGYCSAVLFVSFGSDRQTCNHVTKPRQALSVTGKVVGVTKDIHSCNWNSKIVSAVVEGQSTWPVSGRSLFRFRLVVSAFGWELRKQILYSMSLVASSATSKQVQVDLTMPNNKPDFYRFTTHSWKRNAGEMSSEVEYNRQFLSAIGQPSNLPHELWLI